MAVVLHVCIVSEHKYASACITYRAVPICLQVEGIFVSIVGDSDCVNCLGTASDNVLSGTSNEQHHTAPSPGYNAATF